MCRFVFYLGPTLTLESLVTRPQHSLVRQSYECSERNNVMNADGFGVAWFVPELSPDPAIFRSISPAWSNRSLLDLCRVTQSHCILAHVRAASPGLPVMESNCHPFRAEHLAFMHNGTIPHFKTVTRALRRSLSDESYLAIEGTTDSEHIFALVRDYYRDEAKGAEAMGRALEKAIQHIVALAREHSLEAPCWLNLCISDGIQGAVTRFSSDNGATAPSLYLDQGRRYLCEGDQCRMIDAQSERGAVIVSSERLSDDPGWQRIDANQLITINADREVSIRPLQIT